MKICQIHNEYIHKGGEDKVVEAERKLLKKKRHYVFQIIRKNSKEIKTIKDKIEALINLSYSKKSFKILDNYFLRNELPDIVHIHNIFPLWSYSIFEYFKIKKIPIVMTLHNFRFLWENVKLLKNDKYSRYGLFKNSQLKTFFIAKIIKKNKQLMSNVSMFIVLNKFAKKEFHSIGIPSKKIIIKPNFLENDANIIYKKKKYEKYSFICTSRISQEKGFLTLFEAWKNLDYDLKLFGDGPLKNKTTNNNIKFYGNKKFNIISYHMQKANALILPSEQNEGGLPLSIIEAFQNKTLVIASNHGSMKSEIIDGFNGILFDPGNSDSLREKVNWVIKNNTICKKIINNAYKEYQIKYSQTKNYKTMISIYKKVINNYK